METISHYHQEDITTITLDRGKANPINHQMVKELRQVLRELKTLDESKAAIITGKENFFSAGLDLIELYQYDKDQFNSFWNDFLGLLVDMILFPKPLIASITGHSPAGGTVLALGCDYKVMAQGNFKIGLNEIPVGIIVPRLVYQNYAFHLGHNRAYSYLMEGKMYPAEEAKEIGLINEVAAPEDVYRKAVSAAKKYLSFNTNAWLQTKWNTKIAHLREYIEPDQAEVDVLLEHWWKPETRETMAGFIAAFTKK